MVLLRNASGPTLRNWLWNRHLCCLRSFLNRKHQLVIRHRTSPNWAVLLMLEAKCAWLEHDRRCAVDEAANITGCASKTREGIVAPPCESLSREAIFTWIPCWGMQPWVAVALNSCKLHMPRLPAPLPLYTPPSLSSPNSQILLDRADIIVLACASLSGSWVWCNWCLVLEIIGPHVKLLLWWLLLWKPLLKWRCL